MEFKEYLSASAVQLKEPPVSAGSSRRSAGVSPALGCTRTFRNPATFIHRRFEETCPAGETPALPRLDFKSDLNCRVEHLWISPYVSYDVTNVSSLGNHITAVRWIILARVELDCTQNLS
jgi:hypothetical protein